MAVCFSHGCVAFRAGHGLRHWNWHDSMKASPIFHTDIREDAHLNSAFWEAASKFPFNCHSTVNSTAACEGLMPAEVLLLGNSSVRTAVRCECGFWDVRSLFLSLCLFVWLLQLKTTFSIVPYLHKNRTDGYDTVYFSFVSLLAEALCVAWPYIKRNCSNRRFWKQWPH